MRLRPALAALATLVAAVIPTAAHASADTAWSFNGVITLERFGTGQNCYWEFIDNGSGGYWYYYCEPLPQARFEGTVTRVLADGTETVESGTLTATLGYYAAPDVCPLAWTATGALSAGDISGTFDWTVEGGLVMMRVHQKSSQESAGHDGEGMGTFAFTSPLPDPCGADLVTGSVTGHVVFI